MDYETLEMRYWLLLELTACKSTEQPSDRLMEKCGGDSKKAAFISLEVIQDLLSRELEIKAALEG